MSGRTWLFVFLILSSTCRGDEKVVWRQAPTRVQGWWREFADRVRQYSFDEIVDSLAHRNSDFSAVMMGGMRGSMPGPDSRFHDTLTDDRVTKLRGAVNEMPEDRRAAAASKIFDSMVEKYRTLPARPTKEERAKFEPADFHQLHYSICAALVLVSDFDTVESTLEKVDHADWIIRHKRSTALEETALIPVGPQELEDRLDRLFLTNLYLHLLDQRRCRAEGKIIQILGPAHQLQVEPIPRWNPQANVAERAELVEIPKEFPTTHCRGLYRFHITWQNESGQQKIEDAVKEMRALVVECTTERPAAEPTP